MDAYRILLGLGKQKYIKHLKLAVSYGFAVIEGKNLRLISRTQERRLFNLKHSKYELVKRSDLKRYFQLQLIKNNLKRQQKAIICKARATLNKGRCTGASVNKKYEFLNLNKSINSNISLSYRSAANILGCSVSYAFKQLKDLELIGLNIIKQSQKIDKDIFRFCLNAGYHNIRYDKETGQYLFVSANVVEIKNVYKEVNNKKPVYTFFNH